MSAVYVAERTAQGARVYVVDDLTGDRRPLDPRRDLVDYGSGFDWGRRGPGAAQLALAVLADALGDDEAAIFYHRWLAEDVIAEAPKSGWVLSGVDVWRWQEGETVFARWRPSP